MTRPHLAHNISVAVAGGQVQRCVISAVHDVDAGTTHDKHVHHIGAALAARPVKGAEAVVIPGDTEENQNIHISNHSGIAYMTFIQHRDCVLTVSI